MTTTDTISLATAELEEFDAFRNAHPECQPLTAGPRLVISRAIEIARNQPRDTANRTVAGACGVSAAVLQGMLDRRPEFRELDCASLRNVVVNLIAISRWV